MNLAIPLLLGQSTAGMLFGSSKPLVQQTAKTQNLKWLGQEFYSWAKKLAPIGVGIGTYQYLTQENLPVPETSPTWRPYKNESLIGRGARQFGESYFGSGPMSYYEGQKEALPLTEQLKLDIQSDLLPQAMAQYEAEQLWKAQINAEVQTVKNELANQKQTSKMPYGVRIY